jgi:U3 small nucleolar RNA-associated protein 14
MTPRFRSEILIGGLSIFFPRAPILRTLANKPSPQFVALRSTISAKMPARIARSNTAAGPKTSKSKSKKRSIDAYAAAAKSIPAQRVPRNRLGEVEDAGPRPKRRREQEEEEDEDDEEEEKPQRKRHAKGALGDDDVEYGSDSSGNEWTMGGLAEDDDDSDIDSDEAFGESDEERFSGFTFRGSSSSGKNKAAARSKKRKAKPAAANADIDLDEEESEVTDDGDSEDDVGAGFGDDGIDLAAMLDDDDEEVLGTKDTTMQDMGEDESDQDDDNEESEEDMGFDSEEADDDDDGADEEKVARMRDRLDALDTSKGKDLGTSGPSAAATLDDFLEDTALATDVLGSSKSKKKQLAKASAIAAPLPPRQQDRLDRQVATEKAKEQLERWKDTVVKNRRAEFLAFPLQKPEDQAATVGRTKFAPVTGQAPRNDLEESIQRIMEESGLASQAVVGEGADAGDEEDALLKSEELATNKLPLEEVMRRRAELRRARELLFREELKAKRISKIKSKAYRKVHRKERERLAEQERQAREEMGIEEDEDEKEKADRLRAEARMGTKHKDSKWAKSLKVSGRAAWDDDVRDGVYEQARRNEELKRRIAGKDVSDDEPSDGMSDDEEDEDEGGDNSNILRSVARLQQEKSEGKGLAGMKFMLAADERRRKGNNEDVERLRKELAVQDGDEDEDEDEEESHGLGRAIFGPQAIGKVPTKQKENRLEFEAPDASDAEENVEDDTTIVTDGQSKAKGNVDGKKRRSLLSRDQPTEEQMNGDGSKSLKDQFSWLQAPKGKNKKKVSDAQVELDLDLSNTILKPEEVRRKVKRDDCKSVQKSDSAAGNTDGWKSIPMPSAGSEPDSADDEDSNPLQKNASLKQRAFAGDDVQIAFDAEKADLALSEDEKEVSSYLPGWGAWAGEGLSKKDKKVNTRAKHNPLFKSKTAGVKAADRKDAKLKNVVISEKNERKGRKYLAPVLPHEFESKEQYERSRRLPMGPEWTTKEVHQKSTRPRVVVKAGVVVNALERPIV